MYNTGTMGAVKRVPIRLDGKIVKWAVVDAEDYSRVSQWRWSLNGRGYAMGSPGLMHRIVLGLYPGEDEVDHDNRNKLDNRKANLKRLSHVENCRNSDRSDRASARREQIKTLRAEGLRKREIADRLGVSKATVTGIIGPGDPDPPVVVWTRDALADFFRAFHAEHGRLPRGQELNGKDGRPWFTSVYRVFDSLAEAREYAGFGRIDFRSAA